MNNQEQEKSIFYQAFTRDNGSCIYCSKNLMSSFDTFAQIQLDHLKPKKCEGDDNDILNRVISCFVCNNLKGAYDPTEGEEITKTNRKKIINNAKKYISNKRIGEINNSYFNDYQYWLNIFNNEKC